LLVLGILAAAIAAFFAFGLHHELTWEQLQQRKGQLEELVQQHLVVTLIVYVLLYVAVTGLSLPGAVILTLVGGFLFQRWWGTLIVSCSSTAGATVAFLLTRYLFRAWIENRWGSRLEPINRGVERGGAWYLLTLRLVPLFPFFLINIALGLTRMPVRTFWWVSQVGMLPGTFLYVNAGAELGNLTSPKDILSPSLLGAFVLLGVVPLLLKRLLAQTATSA